MWTCQAIKNGSTYLSEHLTANDYYDEKNQVVGQWHGLAAEQLGLSGAIASKDASFESLRLNQNPQTGEALTQRTSEERIAFYDFQISAPKSVSILAVTFGDSRLRQAHEEAVTAAFAELEKFAARRDRVGDAVRSENTVNTGNLVAARFTHDTSRALDAQLHTHMVCANATRDNTTGEWYALQNKDMFAAVGYAGRAYQAELARRVVALGYKIEEDRENGKIRGFEIAGVTVADRELQSTRRAQIEAGIAEFEKEYGHKPSAAETHVIATETRSKKLSEIATDEVLAAQLAKYDAAAQTRLRSVVDGARGAPQLGIEERERRAREAVQFAIEHRFERDGVLPWKAVAQTALEENLGSVSVADVNAALASAGMVELNGGKSGPRQNTLLTTREYLAAEAQAVDLVNSRAGLEMPLGNGGTLDARLAPDQRAAVETLLASRDGIMAMRGPAGAGKTFTLKEFDRKLAEAGVKSVFVAPTHAAKTVLQEDGFKEADTITQLMLDLRTGKKNLAGKVLVVDEAGMLSAKQGRNLLDAATKAGARVVLVGDEKQLLAVEAGDFLGTLRKYSRLQVAELTNIRRQRDEKYRAAMMAMSQGKVKDGLEQLDAQGRIRECKGEYLDRAAGAYFDRLRSGQTCLMVAPTWAEIDKLNASVRAERADLGELTGAEREVVTVDVANLTKAQRGSAKFYEPGMMVSPVMRVEGLRKGDWYKVESVDKATGRITLEGGRKLDVAANKERLQVGEEKKLGLRVGDKILLQGNDKKAGLINGDMAVVTKLENGEISIKTSRGKDVMMPASYRTFSHGYAVTAEKSQGATVDHVVVAGANISGRRIYVGTSRGRATVEVFVPDKKPLVRSAARGIEERETALGKGVSKVQAPAQSRSRGRSLGERLTRLVRLQTMRIRRFMRTRENAQTHARTRARNTGLSV